MLPDSRVDSEITQSELCPIIHEPLAVDTCKLTLDSSPLAEVNNDPCTTLGIRLLSSPAVSLTAIGIDVFDILFTLSIIFVAFFSKTCSSTGALLPFRIGFSVTPKDGNTEVKKIVDYTCKKCGGEGVLREICDLVTSVKFGKKRKLY